MDKKVALLGILSGMGLIVEMTAISLYLVTYVIAVKRLSTVQSVIWGHFFFKEQGIKERLFASSVILAGVLLIAFAPKT
jgi:drug/metabolite transporter (DMT)-like permease